MQSVEAGRSQFIYKTVFLFNGEIAGHMGCERDTEKAVPSTNIQQRLSVPFLCLFNNFAK